MVGSWLAQQLRDLLRVRQVWQVQLGPQASRVLLGQQGVQGEQVAQQVQRELPV